MKSLLIILLFVGLLWWLYNRDKPAKPQPAPAAPKKYKSLNDWKDDTATLWEGRPRKVSFTYKPHHDYKPKERRTVQVKRVLKDGRGYLYLQGLCEKRDEQRTFRIENITTMIMDGGKRYEIPDWLDDKCGVHDVAIM